MRALLQGFMVVRSQLGKFVNLIVYAACACGLIVSGVLLLSAFGISPSIGKIDTHSMLFAFAAVGAIFVVRFRQITGRVSPRQLELIGLSGCPIWLRAACYGLMLIGVFGFTCSGILQLVNLIDEGTGLVSRTGTFGLLMFSFVFAQLYSVSELARRARNRGSADTSDRLAWSK